VTLYNRPAENLFDSPNGRNALGIPMAQGHAVCQNPDGSLDLYIQADPPSDSNSIASCNWLPSPAGAEFTLLLRMYMPETSVIDGQRVPPAVRRVD
jgi:hypothetical protein